MMVLGVSSTPQPLPSSTSSTTANATLNQVTMLNNKNLSLLSVGLGNYIQDITYFDNALSKSNKL